MKRDDKVNRVTECNWAFAILWFLSYLSLYKNTFNGSLDFIVPPKKIPLFQKGPLLDLQKTYGPFLPCSTSFHMHLLQNCRARSNLTPLRSRSVKTRTLILTGTPGGSGREEGPFPESYLLWARWLVLWEGWTVTLNQLQVALAEAHLCEWPWCRTEEHSIRERITTALQLRTLGLIRVFYKSFAIHFGCSFLSKGTTKRD